MLKEEKELRQWITNVGGTNRPMFLADIRALVRACYEDAASKEKGRKLMADIMRPRK